MSVLADRIRSLSAEVLKNTRSLNLNNVRGSRGVPLRLSHPSGCSIKFDRGDLYFRATEHYFDNHITLTGEGGGDEETYPCIFMENKDYDNDRHLFVSLNNSGYFILGNGSNDIGLACNLNCQMMKITNLPEPTDDYDAANKKYVDEHGGGCADCAKLNEDNIFTGDHQTISGVGGSSSNYPTLSMRNESYSGSTIYPVLQVNDDGYVLVGNDGYQELKINNDTDVFGNIRVNTSQGFLALSPGTGTNIAWFALNSSNELLVTSTNHMRIYTENGDVFFHDDLVLYSSYRFYLNAAKTSYISSPNEDIILHVPSGHKVKIVVG